jgi:CRISPR-associated protein Cas5t
MDKIKLLRLKIFQPSAHYRVPFTFSRRHTYPIPPFSTIIGLICNVLGIDNQENEDFKQLKNGLSLSIYGKYDFLNKEYIWFRNLSKESHKSRFGDTESRSINQLIEHPGGQLPIKIDVLENVRLLIYIKHTDENFLNKIKEAFENPVKRIYPLHLGRAEDLLIFEEIKIIEIDPKKEKLYGQLTNYNFTWLIDPNQGEEFIDTNFYPDNYKDFYDKIQGSYHLITSFYEIIEGIRNFRYIPVKLFEGGSFPLHFGKPFKFIFDENIPLFLTKMI